MSSPINFEEIFIRLCGISKISCTFVVKIKKMYQDVDDEDHIIRNRRIGF
jgi:hypothetical protein